MSKTILAGEDCAGVCNIAERFGTVPSRRTDDAGERLVSCFNQVSP